MRKRVLRFIRPRTNLVISPPAESGRLIQLCSVTKRGIVGRIEVPEHYRLSWEPCRVTQNNPVCVFARHITLLCAGQRQHPRLTFLLLFLCVSELSVNRNRAQTLFSVLIP